jgi:hypothetical protein
VSALRHFGTLGTFGQSLEPALRVPKGKSGARGPAGQLLLLLSGSGWSGYRYYSMHPMTGSLSLVRACGIRCLTRSGMPSSPVGYVIQSFGEPKLCTGEDALEVSSLSRRRRRVGEAAVSYVQHPCPGVWVLHYTIVHCGQVAHGSRDCPAMQPHSAMVHNGVRVGGCRNAWQ